LSGRPGLSCERCPPRPRRRPAWRLLINSILVPLNLAPAGASPLTARPAVAPIGASAGRPTATAWWRRKWRQRVHLGWA